MVQREEVLKRTKQIIQENMPDMFGSVEILLTVYTPSLQTFSGKTGRQRASSALLVPAVMKMESPGFMWAEAFAAIIFLRSWLTLER